MNKRNMLMISGIYALISLVLMCCVHSAPSIGKTDNWIALVNCTLIDCTGNDPVSEAAVIIKNDRLFAAGPAEDIPIPADSIIMDLSGATVLPGFINTHVHYAYDEQTLKAFAQAGITTVRDMQDSDATRMDNRSWFEERDKLRKDPTNSRLLAVGPMLTVPDGYPVYMGDDSEKAVLIHSPEEAARITQELVDAGADTIKIAIENGITFWVDIMFGYRLPSLSADEVSAIVTTAHRNNVKVAAHITNSQDIPVFLEAGGDEIAHMVLDDGLSDDLVNKIVDAGICWGPTLELWAYVEKAPFVLEMDPDYQSFAPAVANLKKIVDAGGTVVLGTDFRGLPGYTDFQYMPMIEIKGMLAAGMMPMQVLMAATKNAAIICNREHDLGTLEKGKIADILVVNGNPLKDIGVLNDPLLVIHNGVIIRNDLSR